MKVEFTALEARIIGCLIEKQITTPDQYPLSLNALVNACNQKSNRDPVMDLDEPTVQHVVDGLVRKHLVLERSGFGSRVPKYRHCFCNTEFGSLKFDPQELSIVCELLLRGPQTPGELRSRASRMAAFGDVSEVESTLERLSKRDDGPHVMRLEREPGRRESRYAQLFSGEIPLGSGVDAAVAAGESGLGATDSALRAGGSSPATSFTTSLSEQRLLQLERDVQTLRAELSDLKARLGG
jgi:uncharacterized protein YceH (UPF0502 family)